MGKYIYDEKNGLWYELRGDAYLPCLKLPRKSRCILAHGDNVTAGI